MIRRSTSAQYTHFGGDVTAQVNSSHGVRLSGGSTGGIVEAVGDDTNIALVLRAQGAGPIRLSGSGGSTLSLGGGSTGQVTLGSTNSTVFVSGSTVPWSGFVRALDTAVTTPALFNDTDAGRVAETTHAIAAISSLTAGVNPGYYVNANSPNLPAGIGIAGAYIGSTAGDVHCRLVKGTTAAIAGTTTTFQFLFIRM